MFLFVRLRLMFISIVVDCVMVLMISMFGIIGFCGKCFLKCGLFEVMFLMLM